jgi:hypothetical protein
MPVAILNCNSLPKIFPKKTIRVKKMEQSEVTICFEMKLSKSDIPVQNKEEEKWRDDVWKQILGLQNIDNKIPIDNEDGFLNKILVEDFHADVKDLKGALASAVCVKALTVTMAAPQGQKSSAPQNQLVQVE